MCLSIYTIFNEVTKMWERYTDTVLLSTFILPYVFINDVALKLS